MSQSNIRINPNILDRLIITFEFFQTIKYIDMSLCGMCAARAKEKQKTPGLCLIT